MIQYQKPKLEAASRPLAILHTAQHIASRVSMLWQCSQLQVKPAAKSCTELCCTWMGLYGGDGVNSEPIRSTDATLATTALRRLIQHYLACLDEHNTHCMRWRSPKYARKSVST